MLRDRAEKLTNTATDVRLKQLIETFVVHPLDDVDGCLEENEGWWLSCAERTLRAAQQQFEDISDKVRQFGGPEKVRIVG